MTMLQDRSHLDLNEEEMETLIHEDEKSHIYESISKFRMHMKSLDEYDDALAEAIEIQMDGFWSNEGSSY